LTRRTFSLQASPSPRRNGVPKTRTKGVPQNFGYIKRSNGSATANEMQTHAMVGSGRTAHVSAVPRTNKLKVSGGTQTTTGDFQQSELSQSIKSPNSNPPPSSRPFLESNLQFKSYSLTGQGAAQLSQSVKERFGNGTNSLPKSSVDMHVFQARLERQKSFPFFFLLTKRLWSSAH
jgi:hypothetical protein